LFSGAASPINAVDRGARREAETDMTIRTRKLVGMVLLVGFVVVYMLLAMVVTAAALPGRPILLQLVGYLVAGLVWIVPAGLVIRWMSRPD
jgi:hypothetical protein